MVKVLVTGASGVLGSAIYKALKATSELTVKGLSHSRPTDDLEPVDLTDPAKVEALISSFVPDWVIHCAAERRPDVANKNPEAARVLNSEVPLTLAKLSSTSTSTTKPFTLIYISTDYVFDGTAAPYEVDAKPHPIQLYGETKLAGEEALRSVESASAQGQRIVLRVPLLYGPVRIASDSAVNILWEIVRDQSGKQYKMDHWATRYPTNVEDIASFLVRLINKYPAQKLPTILHYSTSEPFTKYEMCLVLASLYDPPLPHPHIVADEAGPAPGGVWRPKDCRLSTRVIEAPESEGGLGMTVDAQLFREWWASAIAAEREGKSYIG